MVVEMMFGSIADFPITVCCHEYRSWTARSAFSLRKQAPRGGNLESFQASSSSWRSILSRSLVAETSEMTAFRTHTERFAEANAQVRLVSVDSFAAAGEFEEKLGLRSFRC
jgi:hypothetical protein